MLLNNVTLSYPSLFKKAMYQGKETKYQTEVIIKKDSPEYKALKDAYDQICSEAIASKSLTKAQITPWFRPQGGTKSIVVDCDDDPDKYSDPRYKNAVICSPKNAHRPVVVDRKMHPLTEEDDAIYGGVLTNVFVTFYVYNKDFKGIGLQLDGVQKVADGQPFGAEPKKANDMFTALDGDGYDDDDMFS